MLWSVPDCCQPHSLGRPAAVSVLRCSADGVHSGTLLVRGRLGWELCAAAGGAGPWRADAGPTSLRLTCTGGVAWVFGGPEVLFPLAWRDLYGLRGA